MDSRQRQDLDRHITGNYGEDQFSRAGFDAAEEDGPFLEVPGHFAAWANDAMSTVYVYDPADDGPEVEVITRILAADWYYEIDKENKRRAK